MLAILHACLPAPMRIALPGFYFFYFAALGVLAPHWGPYLVSLGYGPAAIGTMIAVYMGTRIVAPLAWAWLGDVLDDRARLTRWAAAGAVLAFLGIFWRQDYLWLLLVMTVFSAFWNASLPQFEVITMNRLAGREQHYGRVRAWGSVGFIVAAFAAGLAREHIGPETVPVAMLLALIGIWLCTLPVRDTVTPAPAVPSATAVGLRAALRRPPVVALLVLCFLVQFAHAPYYAFFSIYLEARGYSETAVSALWNLGVFAEIFIFLGMGWLLPRFGTRRLLFAVVVLSALRWLLVAFAVDIAALLVLAQVLHMVSFGLYHATAIDLINRFFTGSIRGRGQALYSAISFGLGGALGAWGSGLIYEGWGPEATFTLAALATVLALPTLRWLR